MNPTFPNLIGNTLLFSPERIGRSLDLLVSQADSETSLETIRKDLYATVNAIEGNVRSGRKDKNTACDAISVFYSAIAYVYRKKGNIQDALTSCVVAFNFAKGQYALARCHEERGLVYALDGYVSGAEYELQKALESYQRINNTDKIAAVNQALLELSQKVVV